MYISNRNPECPHILYNEGKCTFNKHIYLQYNIVYQILGHHVAKMTLLEYTTGRELL